MSSQKTKAYNEIKSFVANELNGIWLNGRWHDEENQKPFINHGINLIDLNVPLIEVKDLLKELFDAVIAEYVE
jgi:hypothetical protein